MGFNSNIYQALKREQLNTLYDLTTKSSDEVKQIEGVTKSGFDRVRLKLKSLGYYFSEEVKTEELEIQNLCIKDVIEGKPFEIKKRNTLQEEKQEEKQDEKQDEQEIDDDLPKTPIEELDLSVRAYNRLKRLGIDTVEQLKSKSEDETMQTGLTKKCFEEAIEKMHSMELDFSSEDEEPKLEDMIENQLQDIANQEQKTDERNLQCQTADWERRFHQIDFGTFSVLTAHSFRRKRVQGGVTAHFPQIYFSRGSSPFEIRLRNPQPLHKKLKLLITV